ncbi:MAG: hypothetical protein ACLT3Y_03420 [Ruminococcus callidus]
MKVYCTSTLAPGIRISFNEIHTSSWEKETALYGERMLILNFCVHGRCDASLAEPLRHCENQVCLSTILQQSFYYPGRLYEASVLSGSGHSHRENGQDFLSQMGVPPEQTAAMFCEKNGIYLHRMNDALLHSQRHGQER